MGTLLIEEYPLRGVRLKLARARNHLETLKDEYVAFCERNPLTISVQYEDREYPVLIREHSGEERTETRTQEFAVFRLHIHEHPPLVWSVIIGDCLQNTRAALEHLTWRLAYPEHGGEGPNAGTSFPIYTKRREYRKMKEGLRSKVQQMAGPVQEVIESVQPYQRGRKAKRDPLWILNELARVDRHQVFHVVVATIEWEKVFSAPPGTPGGGAYVAPAHINDELYKRITRSDRRFFTPEDGAELTYTFSRNVSPPYTRRTVGYGANYYIVFSESEAKDATGLPVIETLEHILRHIETEVLPRFMKFF